MDGPKNRSGRSKVIKDEIGEGHQFGRIMYGQDEVGNFPEAVCLNMLGAVVKGGRVVPKGAIVCIALCFAHL